MLLLKLVLAPLLTLAVSLAARVWGHRASGWLTALPIIAAPIAAVLVIEQGSAFVAATSTATLIALPGLSAYIVAFGWAARRHDWHLSLLAGWAAFFAVATPLSYLPAGPTLGLALTWGSLVAAHYLLPRTSARLEPAHIPRVEIACRMGAAVALMLLITYGAESFGPRVSGLLLAFPIGGSVLPAFTRGLHGVEAATHLLRGFVFGMFGFPMFVYLLALLLPAWHPLPAFALGILAVLAMHTLTMLLMRRGWGR